VKRGSGRAAPRFAERDAAAFTAGEWIARRAGPKGRPSTNPRPGATGCRTSRAGAGAAACANHVPPVIGTCDLTRTDRRRHARSMLRPALFRAAADYQQLNGSGHLIQWTRLANRRVSRCARDRSDVAGWCIVFVWRRPGGRTASPSCKEPRSSSRPRRRAGEARAGPRRDRVVLPAPPGRRRDVRIVLPRRKDPHRRTRTIAGARPAWTPDGKWPLQQHRSGVYNVTPGRGPHLPGHHVVTGAFEPQPSPDERSSRWSPTALGLRRGRMHLRSGCLASRGRAPVRRAGPPTPAPPEDVFLASLRSVPTLRAFLLPYANTDALGATWRGHGGFDAVDATNRPRRLVRTSRANAGGT